MDAMHCPEIDESADVGIESRGETPTSSEEVLRHSQHLLSISTEVARILSDVLRIARQMLWISEQMLPVFELVWMESQLVLRDSHDVLRTSAENPQNERMMAADVARISVAGHEEASDCEELSAMGEVRCETGVPFAIARAAVQ